MREIDEQFFRELGCPDPEAAFKRWCDWFTEQRSGGARYRKALELGSGLSAAAIGHYLTPKNRHKLSERSLARLDEMSIALDVDPPKRAGRLAEAPRAHSACRIAILAELADVPSLSFHLEVISSVVRAADSQNFDAVVHDLSLSGTRSTVQKLVSGVRPDAVVFLRRTPDAASLEILARSRVPVVLIHCDRLSYPRPVVANIVPDHENLRDLVRGWAGEVLRRAEASGGSSHIVVAAMPDELERWEFEPLGGVSPSLRNDRKRLIAEGLAWIPTVWVEVPDYSFRHALTIWQEHRDASGFLCLSDSLAVGLKHLMLATDRDPVGRIVGFDDSQLAKDENLSSFGQQLESIGPRVIQLLRERFASSDQALIHWPPAKLEETGFQLSVRR